MKEEMGNNWEVGDQCKRETERIMGPNVTKIHYICMKRPITV